MYPEKKLISDKMCIFLKKIEQIYKTWMANEARKTKTATTCYITNDVNMHKDTMQGKYPQNVFSRQA